MPIFTSGKGNAPMTTPKSLADRVAAINDAISRDDVTDLDILDMQAIITEQQEIMREAVDKLTPIKNVDCYGRDILETIELLTTALKGV